MYQFYYAEKARNKDFPVLDRNVNEEYCVEAIRPAMWEEHCLECSAPLCFKNCAHYIARSDGRCKRFENGMLLFQNERACCGQGVRVKFRKWANMMTIIFNTMFEPEKYCKMVLKNQKLGYILEKVAESPLPVKMRWEIIRTVEYIRRRRLRKFSKDNVEADAFILHGYSYTERPYRLIMEIYSEHVSVFKTSFTMQHGENLFILEKEDLSEECWKANNLVKIYPENDIETELDILWCDFVRGKRIGEEQPAPYVKGVVWDLDNTLWDGTLIETEDPDLLQLKKGVLDVIKQLDERGIVQSVASKNDFDAAWAVIERIGVAEYFLYPQIHWYAKSESMEQIARKLNIGIDSLALIDDSVFERQQVKSCYSQVRVYDAGEIEKLLNYPEFQTIVTKESKRRRLMYRAEEKRNQLLESDNSDTIRFLKKCNLRIDIFEPQTAEERQRCFELVVRTNQLNMSGKKYTDEEFQKVLRRFNHKNFAFSCEDDFGGYGIVGFGQYKVEKSTIVFTEFAMSCRVAGKFVESAFFTELLRRENCNKGQFHVMKTKKNILLRRTLEEIGFVNMAENDFEVQYEFGTGLLNADLVKVAEVINGHE